MRRVKFDGVDNIRYLCTKGEVNRLIQDGKNIVVIGTTPKGAIIEFRN